MKHTIILHTAILFWLILPAGPVEAATWVVDGSKGSDGNPGTAAAPYATVQKGLQSGQPGDTISIRAGTYNEAIATVRSGSQGQPILLKAEQRGKVIITAKGRVLDIGHSYVTFDGLVLDGQYGSSDLLRAKKGSHLTFQFVEIRNSARDCVDLSASPPISQVLFEDSSIHHCLNWSSGKRVDAHGITGTVQDLTIRRTRIYQFSGDAVQFDPNRRAWGPVVIEDSQMWLEPFAKETAGFPKGKTPGENAVDTKTPSSGAKARLIIRRSTFYGFQNGYINNMAALNLKENVEAIVDGCTFYDNEIALRLRGNRGGVYRIYNSVLYRNQSAVRYEDYRDNTDKDLHLHNCTFGLGNGRELVAASSRPAIDKGVRNCLFFGTRPTQLSDPSNLQAKAADAIDASKHKYHLAAGASAIDQGASLSHIKQDRDGTPRPQGKGYDVGAYEWKAGQSQPEPATEPNPPDATGQDAGPGDTTANDTAQPDSSIPEPSSELPSPTPDVTSPDTNSRRDTTSGDTTTPTDKPSAPADTPGQDANSHEGPSSGGCGCEAGQMPASILGLCVLWLLLLRRRETAQ